jgi:hypothetical protein
MCDTLNSMTWRRSYDQSVFIYTPLPGTDALEKLKQLLDQGVAMNAI